MAEVLLVNPRRRRKAKAPKKRASRRRRAPVAVAAPKRRRRRSTKRAKVRRYRRNPSFRIGSVGSIVKGQLVPAAIGASGGVLLSMAYKQVSAMLPADVALKLTTGNMATVTKVGIALGIGIIGGMVTKSRLANDLAQGALTVTLYDAMKAMVPAQYLGEYVSGIAYVNSGYPAGQPALPYNSAMGEYVSGMGEYNAQYSGGADYGYSY